MAATQRAARPFRIPTRIAAVLLYALLAVWGTWPLARDPWQLLPVGVPGVTTVPLLNVWTIWWNSDRLLHGLAGYWNAPIFHPTQDAFAFSEPQPVTLLVAPLIWLTGSRILACNVYLWLSLVLNGVFAERLLRQVRVRPPLAVAGGAAMVLLPIVHWQLDVVQLIPLWGILWTWSALLKAGREPSAWRGCEAGLAFGVTFLTCAHQALFLGLLLALSLWALHERWLRWRSWIPWACAALVAAAMCVPVAMKLHRIAARHNFTRPTEIVGQLSAMPGDYTAAAGRSWIPWGDFGARPGWKLSAGWLKVGLSMIGIAAGLSRRRWRRWTAFLLATSVLAFCLSLGPNLRIGPWQPWWTLTQFVPGFSQVRSAFRFAFFVQAASVLLAAQGLHALCVLNRRCVAGTALQNLIRWLIASLALVAVVEVVPDAPRLVAAPDAAAQRGWIEFVRTKTPPGRAIVCLPFPKRQRVADFERTAVWMYFGTWHGVPLINGYSGFFPQQYFEIQDAANARLPDERVLQQLADAGVEFVVVDRSKMDSDSLAASRFGSFSLERVVRDPVGVDVYRLERTEREP